MTKLTKATHWMRDSFTRPPWTKQRVIQKIESGELPGEIIGGEPFVYENKVLTHRTVHNPSIPNFINGE